MKLTGKILVLLLLAAVAVLLILALRPSPVPVTAVHAIRGYFEEYVEEEGRTVLRDPHLLTAPIGGYLRRVELDAGDRVAAGDLLFELDPIPAPALDPRARQQARESVGAAEARLAQAEAELEARQAELRHAERELERNQRLAEENVVTEAQLDQARSDVERMLGIEAAARRSVDVFRFELRNARAVLEVAEGQAADGEGRTLRIRAPVDGLILRRHRWSEGPIQPGEPVLDLGDLARLQVQVDLLSLEAVRVKESMDVILTRWGGGRDLPARVHRVEPAGFTRISALGVEEQRVPTLLNFTSPRDEWHELGEGYRVEARFILWQGDDVLRIPTSALFRRQDRWVVFVVEEGRAAIRPVETGRRSGLWSQILDGIEEGETIVTHPGDRVTEGIRVAPEIRALPPPAGRGYPSS